MLFALLWACQVEIAPATSAYDTPTATVGRTELGELQILDASGLEGVSDFGAALGFVNGQLVVGETFDGPCPHRLRKLDPGDAPTEGAVLTCPTAGDATFGTTVAGRDRQMVTGDQGLRYNSANGTLSAGAPGVFGPDGALHTSVLVLDGYRTMVGAPLDGPSGAVHTFVTNSVLEYDHALAPPPDLPEGAGFGARIQGTQELLVVETLDGTPSFYVPAEFGWKYWDRVEGPGAGRVLATFGAEILAEDPASDDLLFFTREDGAWVATGVLPGARGTAEHWAFDSVAVFGGRARTPVEPGAIDRWSRFAGALQASLPLTGEHTGLRMELDGDWLAVSELGTGTVSLFDWREERLDLYRELGGHFEELCLQVTSTLEAPIELADFVQEDGTVYAYGDITEDAGVWYRYVLPPHSGFDLTLSNPWHSGSGSLDLDVDTANGVMIDHSATRVIDGAGRRRWDNFGDAPWELFLHVQSINDSNRGCRAFDLVIEPYDHEPGYCEDAYGPVDGGPPALLIDAVGHELMLQGTEKDVYEVSLEPGMHMRVALFHDLAPRDVKFRLRDGNGSILHNGAADVILRNASQYERVYVEVEHAERAPGICSLYVLDVDLTFD